MDKKLNVLLRDFGYKLEGRVLISCGIKGYTSDQIVGNFNSFLSAAEYLIPIIREEEYYNRYRAIMVV
jgi:hypothetical protein